MRHAAGRFQERVAKEYSKSLRVCHNYDQQTSGFRVVGFVVPDVVGKGGSTRLGGMATIRKLTHAPIVEALLDIRVHAAEGVTAESIEQALATRTFGYLKKGPILRSRFGITVSPQEASLTQSELSMAIVGVRMHSSDEKYVAQFTTEGFTLSRMEPYESWEGLVQEARRIWPEYRACVDPTSIQRVAARYINNLRLPVKVGERFRQYLVGLPEMPAEFPQTVFSFLQRFVVYDQDSGATAILTQALESFSPGTPAPVILDIDVFREMQFAPESREVWECLDGFRKLKNRFFFGSLTEAAVELYI
jgi:uncharacterized protein (TIGR04255 family)